MILTACSTSWTVSTVAAQPVSWYSGIEQQPYFYIPLGIALVILLLAIYLKAREIPSNLRARHKSTLDPLQLEELMIGSPPQIVDLRPQEEYRGKRGHIRGSINIPFDTLTKQIEELDTSHPRPIVLVDENDVLSHLAMPLLEARGHRWVYVLKGGFRAWRRAKNPVYRA